MKTNPHSLNYFGRKSGVLRLDVLLLSVAAVAAYGIRAQLPISGHAIYSFQTYAAFFIILITSWLLFMSVFGMYGSRIKHSDYQNPHRYNLPR